MKSIFFFIIVVVFFNIFALKNIKFYKNNIDIYLFSYIFKDIRYFFADLLWLKVDKYHHSGVSGDENLTVLCEIVANLNPEIIYAYIVGAQIYSKYLNKPKEAIKFLKKGIEFNPYSFKLYMSLGYIYFFYLNDFDNAYLNLKKSLKYFDKNEVCEGEIYTMDNIMRILYYIAIIQENEELIKKTKDYFEKNNISMASIDIIKSNYIKYKTKKKIFNKNSFIEGEFEIGEGYHAPKAMLFQKNNWKEVVFLHIVVVTLLLVFSFLIRRTIL